MISQILIYSFVILSIVAIILYIKKGSRNVSYGVFALAFLALGSAGAVEGEKSALAAFILALIASRHIKTSVDRK